jgi:hypothetical protein
MGLRKFFFLCLGAALSTPAFAQCQNADFKDFKAKDLPSRNAEADINPSQTDLAFAQGSASVNLPLNFATGNVNINPGSGGFSTTATTEMGNWSWQITADTRNWASTGEMLVTYVVHNGGKLSSDLQPSSRIDASVVTYNLDVRKFQNKKTRFRGFLAVTTDYANATRAGRYSGTVTVTVQCAP